MVYFLYNKNNESVVTYIKGYSFLNDTYWIAFTHCGVMDDQSNIITLVADSADVAMHQYQEEEANQ